VVTDPWSLDATKGTYITHLEEHNGVLYGLSNSDSKLVKREGGVWSNVCNYPSGFAGGGNGLISFNGELFASFYNGAQVWNVSRLSAGAWVTQKSAPGNIYDAYGSLFELGGILFYSGTTGTAPANRKSMYRYVANENWSYDLTSDTYWFAMNKRDFDSAIHSGASYWHRPSPPIHEHIVAGGPTEPNYPDYGSRRLVSFGGKLYAGYGFGVTDTVKYKDNKDGPWTDVAGELAGWKIYGGCASGTYIYFAAFKTATSEWGIIKYNGVTFALDKIFGSTFNHYIVDLLVYNGELFVTLHTGGIYKRTGA
jgi:hypothetical protein